jgi:hypothetical protein
MNTPSLWPSFGEIQIVKTPKIILQQQAKHLENATSGFITTEVITSKHSTLLNKVSHILRITAPKVEGYSTVVVEVDHDIIKLYPVSIISRIKAMPITYSATNEEELLVLLNKVFEEKETIDTIQSLLTQSKSNESYAG